MLGVVRFEDDMACMCHVSLKLWSLYFDVRKENNTGVLWKSMILKILASRMGKGVLEIRTSREPPGIALCIRSNFPGCGEVLIMM